MTQRFPRPRGDGPPSIAGAPHRHTVSPPTRGWTVLDAELAMATRGFPAHAGMDPSEVSPASTCSWFPRPRGDGPFSSTTTCRPASVSPPTRGWTSRHIVGRAEADGFPAHAGMDRPSVRRSPREPRFPRPRGDGPSLTLAISARIAVSPPTRGWTHVERDHQQHHGGFPAHAGMDRRPPQWSETASRFPRPRGDGPGTGAH